MAKKFLRSNSKNYKRLGRKNKLTWRKPRGRDNKLREKIRGKLRKVSIGFRTEKKGRGKIQDKIVVVVGNLKQASEVKKEDLVMIKKIGNKKRIEVEKKIKELGGKILNKKKLKVKEKKEKKSEEKKNESKK